MTTYDMPDEKTLAVNIDQSDSVFDEKQKSGSSLTRFEDLSNELIIEVYEYLDGCHIFEAFDNLNTRFRLLLNNSLLSLKLNLSSHKSIFQHRCNTVVTPNLHRISSLHISNPLIIDCFLSKFTINASFNRLKALIFDEIKSSNIISLLTNLASLPCLVYLSIIVADYLKFRNDIYRLIFHLPQLKFCRLEYELSLISPPLIKVENVYSKIEHLSIHGNCRLDYLSVFLSYTPFLRRLSCCLYENRKTYTEIPIVPSNLTHVSFELFNISFQQFEYILCQFSSQLRVLRIKSSDDDAYFNAARWEYLIGTHMPHLNTFDIRHHTSIYRRLDCNNRCQLLLDPFTSAFWIERQWFFRHRHYRDEYSRVIFYCISYQHRKNCNSVYDYENIDSDRNNPDDSNSNQQLDTKHPTTDDCYLQQYFHATELIAVKDEPFIQRWWPDHLSQTIVPRARKQTKLNIKMLDIRVPTRFSSLINLQTTNLLSNDLLLDKYTQMGSLPLNNNITKVSLLDYCTVADIQSLVSSFPHVKYLQIQENDGVESIVQYIVKSSYNNNCFSICIEDAQSNTVKIIQKTMRYLQILDGYAIGRFGNRIYLWW